jgi:hypothetical protein
MGSAIPASETCPRTPRPPRPQFRWPLCGLYGLCCSALVACVEPAAVVLGSADPSVIAFGASRPLFDLPAAADDENPSLTADRLELFFSSNRSDGPGGGDLWTAQRSDSNLSFGAPQLLSPISTEFFETSPAVSNDGLTLWFGSDRPGGAGEVDIWQVSRVARDQPWGAPEPVVALNSPRRDIPRPLGAEGTLMPMASQRAHSRYETYLASRDRDGQFAAPQLVEELVVGGVATVDAFLSHDGRILYFTADNASPTSGGQKYAGERGQLQVSWRFDSNSPFGAARALPGFESEPAPEGATDPDLRDPWLAPEGDLFLYVSRASGYNQIYEKPVLRRAE